MRKTFFEEKCETKSEIQYFDDNKSIYQDNVDKIIWI